MDEGPGYVATSVRVRLALQLRIDFAATSTAKPLIQPEDKDGDAGEGAIRLA